MLVPITGNTPTESKQNIPAAEKAAPKLSQQQRLNIATLQAHENVSFSAKGQPQELLYRTALEALKAELEPVFGEGAIEEAYESGLDVSPEATAGRIVGLSTGFFSLFQEQHPELDLEQQVDLFLEVIGGGIDQGFAEAREILDGLNVLEGDIASNIDLTYEFVQSGLADFRNSFDFDAETSSKIDSDTEAS